MDTCPNCGQEKELTPHGICFKCKISSIGVGSVRPCKDCGKNTKRLSSERTVTRVSQTGDDVKVRTQTKRRGVNGPHNSIH